MIRGWLRNVPGVGASAAQGAGRGVGAVKDRSRYPAPAPSARFPAGRRDAGSPRRRPARRAAPQCGSPRPRDSPTRKPGGEQVAGAGGIDQPLDRARRHRIGLLAGHDQAALFAAGDHGKPRIVAQRVDRGVEVGGLVEAVQLALVGEDEIDRAGADEIEEFGAIAVDAERVRQRQRDVALGVMRDLGRLEEGLLGVRRVPQIALEIDDLRAPRWRRRRYRSDAGPARRRDRCSWCARRRA